MVPQDVVPPVVGWTVTAVSITSDLIAIAVKPSQSTSECPNCSVASDRIHSHYVRMAADLPWQGRRVVLRVSVRRFRCPNGGCSRRIFCERLSHLAAWAQTTDRLSEAHQLIGLALGGEAGSRLTNHLAVPTSPDTLLRRVKRTPRHSHPTPRVLGIDDFAFCRGESYGTILMDLERRIVVDLLPDRASGTLAAWLKAHPGVEVVSRDRASAYAQAAREAAPNSTQVADRFHLLMNLRKTVEWSLARQSSAVREAFREQDEQRNFRKESTHLIRFMRVNTDRKRPPKNRQSLEDERCVRSDSITFVSCTATGFRSGKLPNPFGSTFGPFRNTSVEKNVRFGVRPLRAFPRPVPSIRFAIRFANA